MTVNLSALAGAGQQFLDDSGNVLTGGKLYSYAAGTTTPQVTYTTASGNVPHSNPIILNAAGRVATGEIWLTAGENYKFVLYTSTDVLIASWDNITGINGTGIATNALYVQYDPAGTGAVSTNVQAKLRQTVSIMDFGAVGDGATDDTTAIANALAYAGTVKCGVYVPGTAASYRVTDEFTVPDGVSVYGDGWGSFIQQTTQNKDVFIAGDCNTFQNIRLKIADGNNTDFTNCIFANSVNNLTVESCFLESADLGGCGIHIRGVQNSQIRGNRIYGGKWSSGASAAASAADILFYSSNASERHIVEGNHCLSNNSQGIFVAALGYDADVIVSNNICVTLDPTTCTETGTWSLVANGGVRRHGIVISYNSTSVSGPRLICDSNICRNTRWTGIYKQGAGAGSVTISNNLCDLNGYEPANSLAGGIFINQSGNESIVGNYITNYQNTGNSTGGITVVGGSDEPILIANNVIQDSLGNGLFCTILARNIKIDGNVFISNAGNDIYYLPNAGATNAGGLVISNNQTYRTINLVPSIYLDPQAGLLTLYVTNNRLTGFDNTTLNTGNTGIDIRVTTALDKFVVKNNDINNFYYGIYSGTYLATSRSAVLSYNTIKDCAVGFGLGATTSGVTVPLIGNQFINVTTPSGAVLGGGVAGRLVQQIGDNFVWQTTASPTAGSWIIGDRSQNSAPAIGSPKAWACTVAGTPGTWVSEGNL